MLWRKRLGVEPSPPAVSGGRPILKTGRATGPRSLPYDLTGPHRTDRNMSSLTAHTETCTDDGASRKMIRGSRTRLKADPQSGTPSRRGGRDGAIDS